MSAKALASGLQMVAAAWIEKGLALDFAGLRLYEGSNATTLEQNNPPAINFDEYRLCDYERCLDRRAYWVLLHDRSFVQLQFSWEAGVLVKSRYVYFPCPYDGFASFDRFVDDALMSREIRSAAPGDQRGLAQRQVRCVTPVRLEHDASAVGLSHPATHAHLNRMDSRLPCHSQIPVREFLRFVCRYGILAGEEAVQAYWSMLEDSCGGLTWGGDGLHLQHREP
jgi:hypothetical protein